MKIYPAIDLFEGKVVRLLQGRFEDSTTYSSHPLEVASEIASAGGEYLHLVDLCGARAGSPAQTDLISRIVKESRLKVQVGGGIRRMADVEVLLNVGVDRVVLGSLAVKDRDLTREIFLAFGPNRITLALDVKVAGSSEPEVAIHGWKEGGGRVLWDVVEDYSEFGAIRILCTDVGRDGMLEGPNVILYRSFQSRYPGVEVQASGGVGKLTDLRALREAGIPSVVVGKALYEKRFTLAEALGLRHPRWSPQC